MEEGLPWSVVTVRTPRYVVWMLRLTEGGEVVFRSGHKFRVRSGRADSHEGQMVQVPLKREEKILVTGITNE